MSVKIITDSAADLPAEYIADHDVTVIPMTTIFGETEYIEGVTISHHEFYEKLIEDDTLPKTSQLAPHQFAEIYQKVVSGGNIPDDSNASDGGNTSDDGNASDNSNTSDGGNTSDDGNASDNSNTADDGNTSDGSNTAVVITLSSKLSGTYQNAVLAAAEYEGVVFVVDSLNATVGEQVLVKRAVMLAEQGKSASEIADTLCRERSRICLIALLDTLEYLKKGGRISPTTAFVGNMLSIKPVVTVRDGEVVMIGKARGSKKGNNMLIEYINEHRPDFDCPVALGYTGLSDILLQKYIADSSALWTDRLDTLPICTVGSTIGTHVGPGAIAVAYFQAEI
ncbi:MAG: DegV family protein [bacterium]|nr:DegV family protein [bacterium]